MKTKLHNIIKGMVMAAVAVTSLGSCNDFLTITPSDKTVEEDFWKTKEDVDNMVNGAYQKMLSSSIIERFIMWGEYRSDFLQKNPLLSSTNLDNISNLDLYPSNGYNSWAAFYNVINTCNIILQKAPNVMAVDPEYTSGDNQTVCAQMYGLRALCHFYLIRTFRDIPYVTKAYASSDQVVTEELDGQAAPDSTLQLCINDLENAISGCYKYGTYGKGSDDDLVDWRNVGYLSKDAIYAILADVYLWRASMWHNTDKSKAGEYYLKCAEYCDKIIQSHEDYYVSQVAKGTSSKSADNEYRLLQEDAYNKNFVQGNSRESIFELQFDGSNNSNDALRANYYKYSESAAYGNLAATKMVGMPLLESQDSISSYSSSTERLFQSANDYRYYESAYGVNDDNNSYFQVRKMVDKEISVSSIPNNKKGISFDGTRLYSNFRQNWIVYRITDILLMKAEAIIEMANLKMSNQYTLMGTSKTVTNKKARGIIHQVNLRSINKNYWSTDSINSDHNSSYASAELLCLQERGRELCMEGKRWYDLLRHSYRHMKGVDPTRTMYEISPTGANLPSVRNNDNYLTSILGTRYSSNLYKMKNEAHLYWPILQSETKNNTKLHQNPVWVETQSSERGE